MISQDDIEAFADDLEIADRIVERAKAGVVDGRHIMANEVMPLIRAYVLMLDIASRSAEFMTEQHKRELRGLDINRDD